MFIRVMFRGIDVQAQMIVGTVLVPLTPICVDIGVSPVRQANYVRNRWPRDLVPLYGSPDVRTRAAYYIALHRVQEWLDAMQPRLKTSRDALVAYRADFVSEVTKSVAGQVGAVAPAVTSRASPASMPAPLPVPPAGALAFQRAIPADMPAITKPTSPFAFDGHPVRVELDASGEPWFVAKDVAEALGYEWKGSGTVQHVPDRWRMILSVWTTSGRKDALALSESGMNFFVMRSNKPAAIPFQEWIAGEVLPSIRRTGSYTKPVAAPSTSDALALAHALIAAEASNRALRADNAQVSQQLVSIQAELDTAIDVASTATERADAAEPLAKVAKEFLHTEGGLTLAVVGTQLGQSQQWMFRALREVGWIVKKSVGGKLQNLPSQRALDAGLMLSRISTHTDLEGRAHHSVQPLVTPRGARRLHELHAQGELGI